MFLPNLRLRDLDGATITLQPQNKLSEAVAFLVRLQKLSGYKRMILQHIKQFCRIYKNDLSIANRVLAQYSAFLLCAPKLSTLELSSNHAGLNPFKRPQRAFIGSYDRLDPAYQPAFAIDPHYRHYFKPTRLTDREGNICENLLPDIYAGH